MNEGMGQAVPSKLTTWVLALQAIPVCPALAVITKRSGLPLHVDEPPVHSAKFAAASELNAAAEVAVEGVLLWPFEMNHNWPAAVFDVQLGLVQIEVLDIEVAFKSTLVFADGAAIDSDCVVL